MTSGQLRTGKRELSRCRKLGLHFSLTERSMHDPEEIARAFLVESDVDYRVTQLLRGTEFHSRTIAFAQQAVEELVRHIDLLERHGARPRFPLFQRRDLPLWVPSRDYREEDALRALHSADYVVQRLRPHLDRILAPRAAE